VTGAAFVMALVVASATLWLFQLRASSMAVNFVCTKPSVVMAQAIDARMHDPRTRVDHLRGIDTDGSLYSGLFFSSANVRVDGVFVGIGTWASNFRDFGGSGPFRGWSHVQRYYILIPVNDLAQAISSNPGDLRDPGMTRAATFSQQCVGPSPTA
jgi:hypothetical protein